jgi:predicted NBD/HSP70 family sugar kinase
VTVVGGIEAGGTKWLCAVGTGPGELAATETIPTTPPLWARRSRRRPVSRGRARSTAIAGRGLAAGPAIEARWGRPPRELGTDESVWRLEARYVALGLVNVVAVLSPERVVLGGGVMDMPGLLALVRAEVDALLAGYAATEILPPARPAVRRARRDRAGAQRSTVTSVPIGVYGHTFAAASRGSSTQPRLCGVPKEARLNAWIPSPPLK